ncbi:flavoprotein [Plantactinospora sp. GCM10030261]|uniref:flavoprotein n=1 Tax=Plantactinospora sp. GCM10030261 TaxID=3273420 RepID=UPI003608C919
MTESGRRPVLHLVVCGSPRAARTAELVGLARAAGWSVIPIATPYGLRFLDVPAVEAATGQPVRHEFRRPDEPKTVPDPAGVLVCPATFNTVNKLAAGMGDTLALALVAEGIGRGVPVVVAPAVNTALAAHPAFVRSLGELAAAGVGVLYGPGVYQPNPPGAGESGYPLELAVRALGDPPAVHGR